MNYFFKKYFLKNYLIFILVSVENLKKLSNFHSCVGRELENKLENYLLASLVLCDVR